MKSHAGLGLGTVRKAFVKSYGTVEEQQKTHLPYLPEMTLTLSSFEKDRCRTKTCQEGTYMINKFNSKLEFPYYSRHTFMTQSNFFKYVSLFFMYAV